MYTRGSVKIVEPCGITTARAVLLMFYFTLGVLTLTVFISPPSFALWGSIDVGMGHDSNPSLAPSDEDGEAFTSLSTTLTQGIALPGNLLFSLDLKGEGKKYIKGEWDHTVSAQGEISYISSDGRFQPSIFFRGSAVRAQTVPEDDRDVATFGADVQLYPRDDLGVRFGISFDWLDFRRDSSIVGSRTLAGATMGYGNMMGSLRSFSSLKAGALSKGHTRPGPGFNANHVSGQHMMNPGTGGPQGMSQNQAGPKDFARLKRKSRNDRYESIYLSIQKDVLSSLTLSLTGLRERLFSSISYESFTRYGTGLGISLSIPKNMEASISFFWRRARFRETIFGNRTDYTRHVYIEVIRPFKKLGISIYYSHITNDSSLNLEDYRKNVTAFRLSYYF